MIFPLLLGESLSLTFSPVHIPISGYLAAYAVPHSSTKHNTASIFLYRSSSHSVDMLIISHESLPCHLLGITIAENVPRSFVVLLLS